MRAYFTPALSFLASFAVIFLLLRSPPPPAQRAPPLPLPQPQPPLRGAPPPLPSAAPPPAPLPPPLPAFCPAAPPYRGILDPATLHASLAWAPAPAPPLLLAHAALPDAACARYVYVDQNTGAGAGHRVRQWVHGLFVAASLRGAAAHLHTTLDQGVGAHGGYAGLDELLGLPLGEGALRLAGAGSSGAEAPALLEARGIATVPLPRATEHAYCASAPALEAWGARLAQSDGGGGGGGARECSVAYRLPMDQWAVDTSTATRGVCAWKFAAAQARAGAAAAARARARAPDPGGAHHRALLPPSHWPPSALHVGVHFRVSDGKLVSAAELAGVVRGTLLPAMAAAAAAAAAEAAPAPAAPLRVIVHVFSESEEPLREAAELMALHGALGGGAAAAPGLLLPLEVHHAGAGVGVLDALWQLSQCDFFVGSVSSLSWTVAQFASRPLPLMQEFGPPEEYRWCLEHAVCCRGGSCEAGAGSAGGARLRAAAERLARMAACGQLGEPSWRAPSMPQVEAEAAAEVAREVAAAAAALPAAA